MEEPIEKIPSRFKGSAPVAQPAGAPPSLSKIKSPDLDPAPPGEPGSIELISVRFPNGSTFHYQAGYILEERDCFRLLVKKDGELVAIVAKQGFVVEATDPYAVEIAGQENTRGTSPLLSSPVDGPGQLQAVTEEKPLGFFRALCRFLAIYYARPQVIQSGNVVTGDNAGGDIVKRGHVEPLEPWPRK